MKLEDPTLKKAVTANRPTIMGTKHVIAAGHYLAAHAGFEILEAGGNAIDAGVAAGITAGVVQTDKVNFGGVAPQIIYLAKKRELHCIDGLGVWPKAITPDYFVKHHGGKIPAGVLRSVVPAGIVTSCHADGRPLAAVPVVATADDSPFVPGASAVV